MNKIKNIPQKIYLQVEGAEDGDNFNELSVTWCTDKINESDIEYNPSTAEHSAREVAEKAIKWVEKRITIIYWKDVDYLKDKEKYLSQFNEQPNGEYSRQGEDENKMAAEVVRVCKQRDSALNALRQEVHDNEMLRNENGDLIAQRDRLKELKDYMLDEQAGFDAPLQCCPYCGEESKQIITVEACADCLKSVGEESSGYEIRIASLLEQIKVRDDEIESIKKNNKIRIRELEQELKFAYEDIEKLKQQIL